MQKCPNFIRNFWFKFFCQIFAKLLAKKRRVGEGVWRVWNLVCKAVWKKAQNSIFVRRALHGANIFYHLYHQTDIWRSFYQPHSTGPQHIHHTLFLIKLLLVLLQICWLVGLQSTRNQIYRRKRKCISNILVWNKWTRMWNLRLEFSYWQFSTDEVA